MCAPLTSATSRDKLVWRPAPHLMEGMSLPATPSKSKLPGRRGCSLTSVLVLCALVAAVAIFNQDLGAGMGASRTETYYRKAMVAKMVFGADGQTLTATSEEYSRRTAMVKPRGGAGRAVAAGKAGAVGGKAGGKRGDAAAEEEAAALELAVRGAGAVQDLDGADDGGGEQALPGQGQQVVTTVTAVTISSSSGTSSAATAAHQEHMAAQRQAVAAEAAAAAAAATSAEQQAADAEAVEQQQQQQQQAQQQQAAAEEEAAARQRQQQQEEQQAEQPAEPAGGAEAAEDVEAWWSDVIAPSGERLPKAAKRERDISASLATAVTFDESSVQEQEDCKIAVIDVDKEWGAAWGAGGCDLADPNTWPFNRPGRGIDGTDALPAEHYQYSMEHWIAQSIRNSSRFTPDMYAADFIFVDFHCYHAAWMAWLHPASEELRRTQPSPETFIKRGLTKMQGMRRFRETKGGSFGLVHPAPLMKDLFSEEQACEDLASVLNMVPERSQLCVWTQDSHTAGKSVLLPYAAVSDIDVAAPVAPASDRETLVFFQGGCGSPDPAARPLFAAGKMLRWELVQALQKADQPDIHAECTCDICDGHKPHAELTAAMGRSVFCPILPSNTQSSRRLSEAMLTGCIPVFVGEPFHTLPLAGDVDWASFALFVNVSDNAAWVNNSSPKWEQNHMIAKAWKLDDPKVAASVVPLRRLEDLLRLLRSMPADEVAARQAGVIANRLKFWYPAAPAEALAASAHAAGGASLGMAPGAATATAGSLLQHGGGARRSLAAARGGAGGAGDATLAALAGAPGAQPGASVLGELLMRKMCRRAAAVKKRVAESARQGLDFKDSDEKVEHPALAAQPSGAEAEEGEEVPAATTTRGRKAAGARRQRHML